ncbi:MAG: hypothetical protein AAFY60_20135, partial [Myxococcota bacterium]
QSECPDPSLANPGSNAGNVGHFFTAIYDVFACDLSSSVGFVFDAVGARWGAEARRIDFDHDPAALNFVSSRYYQVSHGRTERHELAQAYVALSRTHRLKDLLDLLATTPENGGDGMLLDNTVIYYGSAMTGNTHAWAGNYAHFIVAGKNTNVKTGWHYDCSGATDCDVYTTLAQGAAVPLTTFGGYSGNNRRAVLNNGPITKMLKTTLG